MLSSLEDDVVIKAVDAIYTFSEKCRYLNDDWVSLKRVVIRNVSTKRVVDLVAISLVQNFMLSIYSQ